MAVCPHCGGNLNEKSGDLLQCDNCGKIWSSEDLKASTDDKYVKQEKEAWLTSDIIDEKCIFAKTFSKTVNNRIVFDEEDEEIVSKRNNTASEYPASDKQSNKDSSVDQHEGLPTNGSNTSTQYLQIAIEELSRRLLKLEAQAAVLENKMSDSNAKRAAGACSFTDPSVRKAVKEKSLKVILPIFLLLIALITLLSCFCGLRGIYVNVDNPNEFYSFSAIKYEYHTTLSGEEYTHQGTWKKSEGNLGLTYTDEISGNTTLNYGITVINSYKEILITNDLGVEREYKRVSLMAYSTPQKVTVKFNMNDASNNVDKVRVDLGGKITEPEVPVRNGYEFMGWYTDKDGWRNGKGKKFSENKRVWEKTEYYANWKSSEEFYLSGDFIDQPLKFKEGTNLNALYSSNVKDELLKGEWEIVFVQKENEDNVVDGSFAPASDVVARLVSVVIPDSVTSIGNEAFSGCTKLTAVTIPGTVTSIGRDAFLGCTKLLQKENGVSYVDKWAIDCDTSVNEVTLRSGTVGIGDYAFYDCKGLLSVSIVGGVTDIGDYAFYGCTELTSATIPASVLTIGEKAFSGSSSLTVYCEAISGSAEWESSWNSGGCTVVWAHNNITTDSDYDYTVHGDIVYLTRYKGNATDVVIPSAIDGKTVAGFGTAFNGHTSLTSIVIPDSVIVIGGSAFSDCTRLKSVIIPNSVKSIGKEAFSDCAALTTVTIGDSVESIGEYAFYRCTGLTSVYYTGDIAGWCVISFGDYYANPLYNARNLYIDGQIVEDLVIPDSVTDIKDYTFYSYRGLISVVIPDSVVSIGNYVFDSCYRLVSLTIPDSVTRIGDYAYEDCSGLMSVTIGNSVKSIGNYAFSDCRGLASVTIGNSVTSIGSSTFSGCTGLTSVYYTGDIAGWCGISFDNSYANPLRYAGNLYIDGQLVGDVVIPDSVTEVKDYAFYGCTGLTSVTIPDSVTSIGDYAFDNCRGLTSVTIPDSVMRIGEYTFYNCTGLTSVTIGNSVTSIGSEAFRYCYKLVEVYNKNSLDITAGSSSYGYIGYYAKNVYTKENGSWFTDTADGYRFFYDGTDGYFMEYRGEASNISLPESFHAYDGTLVENYKIYECAFFGHAYLQSIVIPDFVTSIGDHAFEGCTGLISVTIPDSVTSIGYEAFSRCMELTSVYYTGDIAGWCGISFDNSYANPLECADELYIGDQLIAEILVIPDSVTEIKDYAFSGCTGLTSITIPDSVTSIGYSAFSGCAGLTSVYYTGDIAGWCGISFSYQYANPLYYAGNLYIDGQLVTDLVIPDSVTKIKDYAFSGCTGLTSVTIGNSVTSIEYSAFEGCTGLTSITIPDSVTSIGDYAFEDCTGLTSVTIPDSVTSIEYSAFEGCTGLTSITIPDSVTSIGYSAFSGCAGLTSVYYTGDIAGWCGISFGDMYANPLCYAGKLYIDGQLVTDLVIPDSVTSIGEYAFSGCTNLTSVVFGDTEGWQVSRYSDFSDYTSLSSADLADASTAATYLKSTYREYYWRRVEAAA